MNTIPTIGILTNSFELPRSQSLISALKKRNGVYVETFVEEHDSISSMIPPPKWDLCFVKGRGKLVQAHAYLVELAGIPTHNCANAIHVTNYRFLTSLLARSAGVPEPEFAVGYEKDVVFEDYIVKEECVESSTKFIPVVGHRGKKVIDDKIYFFQRKINSQWEYKVYSFGEIFLYFKEKPTLEYPDKMETRVVIPENPLLREYVEKIKKITKLTITSMDFLEEGGQFYLTDVNSAPNFNYIKDGPEILAKWFLKEIKS